MLHDVAVDSLVAKTDVVDVDACVFRDWKFYKINQKNQYLMNFQCFFCLCSHHVVNSCRFTLFYTKP